MNDIALSAPVELAIPAVTIEQNPPVVSVEQGTATAISPLIGYNDNNYNDNQLKEEQPVVSALVSAIDQDDLSDSSSGTDESQTHPTATADLLSVLDQQLTATVPATDVSTTSSNEMYEAEENQSLRRNYFGRG
nr:hypothetical protein KXZ65_15720 [Pectobacterium sp. PL152]